MYTYSPTLLRVLEARRPTNDKHAECSVLVSNHLSPVKGTRDLCEVFDPRTTTGKVQDDPKASCGARKQGNVQKR